MPYSRSRWRACHGFLFVAVAILLSPVLVVVLPWLAVHYTSQRGAGCQRACMPRWSRIQIP